MGNRFDADGGVEIPEMGSREEEAKFFDSTDLTDLAPGVLEPVEIERPSAPLSTTFAIRLDQATVDKIRQIAEIENLKPTQLVRYWVQQRVRVEEQGGVLAEPFTDLPSEKELNIRRRAIEIMMTAAGPAVEAIIRLEMQRVRDGIDTEGTQEATSG